ncbi:uncharacterized protein LOC117541025 isoform X2 [Gymnodraco acuticeps]|uniref:Uncharacterized protein LOC117541025 isoform X2 n=1 Tax=Gymnodraco acuticeps TaxID=8218 RepID=A0A6P8TZ58_GYMAC|nr:uncharacterized protein LOC117541025 isoform X2 [Gymnodraco acuticeps]
MIQKILLLTLLHLVVAAPRPASPQMIQADEGENATVWCRFIRPEDFAPTALHWTVNVTKDVLFSRHKGWIDPDAADAQYTLRTSVNREDLARGILLVNISNVTPSDSGNYEGVVIGKLAGHDDPLELNCSVELIVAAEQRNHVLGVLILVAFLAVVIAVGILVERGVIRICKKEGEPKTSEGDQQSAAEEGLVGSEVTDSNNQPSHTVY